MDNRIRKTSKKERERKCWAPDLPQEILRLILEKIQHLTLVDIIRFRAVCKNWRDDMPQIGYVHQNLPWLCKLSWGINPRVLQCEIYDPYARQIFKTSKWVDNRRYTSSYSRKIECLGSKQGWLIACYHNHFIKWEIFMYNPYRTELIPLPFIWKYCPHVATFAGDPVSRDCRVFVFSRDRVRSYITSYGLNNDDMKEWRLDFVDDAREHCCGMQYVNEHLLCLFNYGNLMRYNLADGSCTQLVLGEGSHRLTGYDLRLSLAEGDVLVACELRTHCRTLFYFDWPNMSWVRREERNAVFVSDKATVFVSPFDDHEDKLCEVYAFEAPYGGVRHPSYYSFNQKLWKSHFNHPLNYFCAVFIEPPRIN